MNFGKSAAAGIREMIKGERTDRNIKRCGESVIQQLNVAEIKGRPGRREQKLREDIKCSTGEGYRERRRRNDGSFKG